MMAAAAAAAAANTKSDGCRDDDDMSIEDMMETITSSSSSPTKNLKRNESVFLSTNQKQPPPRPSELLHHQPVVTFNTQQRSRENPRSIILSPGLKQKEIELCNNINNNNNNNLPPFHPFNTAAGNTSVVRFGSNNEDSKLPAIANFAFGGFGTLQQQQTMQPTTSTGITTSISSSGVSFPCFGTTASSQPCTGLATNSHPISGACNPFPSFGTTQGNNALLQQTPTNNSLQAPSGAKATPFSGFNFGSHQNWITPQMQQQQQPTSSFGSSTFAFGYHPESSDNPPRQQLQKQNAPSTSSIGATMAVRRRIVKARRPHNNSQSQSNQQIASSTAQRMSSAPATRRIVRARRPKIPSHSNQHIAASTSQTMSSPPVTRRIVRARRPKNITHSNQRISSSPPQRAPPSLATVKATKSFASLSKKAKPMPPIAKAGMESTAVGKAWTLVEAVLQALENQKTTAGLPISHTVLPVTKDKMVSLMEKLILQQEHFALRGKPICVDIGYHWTTPENLERIASNGLLTKAERDGRQIDSKHNGSMYGDGVYTADDPYKFREDRYGALGIMVVRLQGSASPLLQSPKKYLKKRDQMEHHDTIVGLNNKGTMRVLRRSSQCVPLLHFDSKLVEPKRREESGPGNEVVFAYHIIMQQLLDKFLNNGKETCIHKSLTDMKVPSPGNNLPSTSTTSGSQQQSKSNKSASGTRQPPPQGKRPPTTTKKPKLAPEKLQYTAPASLELNLTHENVRSITKDRNETKGIVEECSICLSALSEGNDEAVELTACGHGFHFKCIRSALANCHRKCPICRKSVCAPLGKMPSGTMKISSTPLKTCLSYEPGVIIVEYEIFGGTQKAYHESPGKGFAGIKRKAYIPDNDDGRDLLKRLKYAFMHGLTFSIGTSMTTGRTGVVTWSSIHHKTSPSYSTAGHGFPDTRYFSNVNEELDALGVPHARKLG